MAGTVLQGSKLALTVWFLAICLIGQAKTGLSAPALKHRLGVSCPTAWLIHHKLMQALPQREDHGVLEDQVQVDHACLGGERSGAKVGRGSGNKAPFVAAVSLSDAGHPLHVKLMPVPGRRLEAIAQWARDSLAPGCAVLSDGLACFSAATAAGCAHPCVVMAGRRPREMPGFEWINTVLGSVKCTR